MSTGENPEPTTHGAEGTTGGDGVSDVAHLQQQIRRQHQQIWKEFLWIVGVPIGFTALIHGFIACLNFSDRLTRSSGIGPLYDVGTRIDLKVDVKVTLPLLAICATLLVALSVAVRGFQELETTDPIKMSRRQILLGGTRLISSAITIVAIISIISSLNSAKPFPFILGLSLILIATAGALLASDASLTVGVSKSFEEQAGHYERRERLARRRRAYAMWKGFNPDGTAPEIKSAVETGRARRRLYARGLAGLALYVLLADLVLIATFTYLSFPLSEWWTLVTSRGAWYVLAIGFVVMYLMAFLVIALVLGAGTQSSQGNWLTVFVIALVGLIFFVGLVVIVIKGFFQSDFATSTLTVFVIVASMGLPFWWAIRSLRGKSSALEQFVGIRTRELVINRLEQLIVADSSEKDGPVIRNKLLLWFGHRRAQIRKLGGWLT